jgi:alpha-tubulin suppressor-like RCC1 family protein
VALGQDHTLALDSDARTVYAWGKSSEGQLGVGGSAFLRPPCVSPALSAPAHGAAFVRALHALGDCSAAAHEHPTAPAPTVVYVGKKCRELEQALRGAMNFAKLQ